MKTITKNQALSCQYLIALLELHDSLDESTDPSKESTSPASEGEFFSNQQLLCLYLLIIDFGSLTHTVGSQHSFSIGSRKATLMCIRCAFVLWSFHNRMYQPSE